MKKLKQFIDPYIAMLLAAVLVATILPARGAFVAPIETLSNVGIFVLFFLYGARLSTAETIDGIKHWRLHLLVLAFTYVLFPLLGVALSWATKSWQPELLVTGLVFLSLLPSTVQSSVTFTSMAKGNVAASIVAASISNLLGVFLTPLLVFLVMRTSGITISGAQVQKLALQLLLPFILGQIAHRWLGAWLKKNKGWLGWYDKGTIILIVYVAFSAGMRAHMWTQVSVPALLIQILINAVLLALVMVATIFISKWLGFSWPDRIAIIFAGSKKSMASGLPMAQVIFPAATVGIIVLPLMLFHQFQLIVCAQLARIWGRRDEEAAAKAVEEEAAG